MQGFVRSLHGPQPLAGPAASSSQSQSNAKKPWLNKDRPAAQLEKDRERKRKPDAIAAAAERMKRAWDANEPLQHHQCQTLCCIRNRPKPGGGARANPTKQWMKNALIECRNEHQRTGEAEFTRMWYRAIKCSKADPNRMPLHGYGINVESVDDIMSKCISAEKEQPLAIELVGGEGPPHDGGHVVQQTPIRASASAWRTICHILQGQRPVCTQSNMCTKLMACPMLVIFFIIMFDLISVSYRFVLVLLCFII